MHTLDRHMHCSVLPHSSPLTLDVPVHDVQWLQVLKSFEHSYKDALGIVEYKTCTFTVLLEVTEVVEEGWPLPLIQHALDVTCIRKHSESSRPKLKEEKLCMYNHLAYIATACFPCFITFASISMKSPSTPFRKIIVHVGIEEIDKEDKRHVRYSWYTFYIIIYACMQLLSLCTVYSMQYMYL